MKLKVTKSRSLPQFYVDALCMLELFDRSTCSLSKDQIIVFKHEVSIHMVHLAELLKRSYKTQDKSLKTNYMAEALELLDKIELRIELMLNVGLLSKGSSVDILKYIAVLRSQMIGFLKSIN
jgi:hypothetical protein